MVDINSSGGGPDDGVETSAPKKDFSGLLKSARQDFVSEKIGIDINYFKNITNKDFSVKLRDEFGSYLGSVDRFSELGIEYAGYSLEERNQIVSQLKQNIIQENAKVSKNEETLNTIFLEDFDFGRVGKKKLKKALGNISKQTEVNELLKTQKSRLNFLAKNKISEFSTIEPADILNDLKIEKIDIDNLTQAQKEALFSFQYEAHTLSDTQYLALLSVFPIDKQKKILAHFNKSISLGELIKQGIFSEEKATQHVLKTVKKAFPKLSAEEIKKSFNEYSDFSDIFISPSDLEKEDYNKLLNKESVLKDFFNEMNSFKEEQQNHVNDDLFDWLDLDKKGNIHQNFINYIKHPGQKSRIMDDTLSSIDEFKPGSYLESTIGGETVYYYIEDVDLGATKSGKAVKLKNLSSAYGNKLKSKDSAPSQVLGYKSVYKLLVSASEQKDTGLRFISEKSFNDLDLNEVDDENSISTEADLREKLFHLEGQDSSLAGIGLTGLCFLDKNNKPPVYRSFSHTNDSNHELTFNHSGQKLSYTDFFAAFKKGTYKLEKRIDNAEDAIAASENMGDLALHKSGKKMVLKPLANDTNAHGIKYFTSGTKAIKVEKLNDGSVKFLYGGLSTEKKEEKGGKKKEIKNFKPEYTCTDWNQFVWHINGSNLKPDIENEKNIQNTNDDVKKLEEKPSFFGYFSKAMSLEQMMMGGTMFIDSLKEHLERGDKLKAAKFAERFGFMLPEGARAKLTASTEGETKKLINELVDELKEKASGYEYALKQILENPKAQPREVYAGMTFMIKKTGSLKAKNSKKYKGGYPWYEKLGGKVGDPFFEKEKAKALKTDGSALKKGDASNFTEEKLVESFLKTGGIKSQLFERAGKDFGSALVGGIKEEMEDGENKTGDENTITDKVEYFKDVLSGNEQANAIGSLKELFSKNTEFESMNAAPFLLVMSGVGQEMVSQLLNEVTGLAYGTAYTYLSFALSPAMTKNFQDTMVAFFNDTNRPKTGEKLQKILSMEGDGENLEKKINSLYDFWNTHNEELTEFINLVDGRVMLNKDKEPYATYFANMKGVFTDGGYGIAEDQLDEGIYDRSGLASVGAKYNDIVSDSSAGYGPGKSRKVVGLYFKRLHQIKDNPKLSREEKKKLFLDIFLGFENASRVAIGRQLNAAGSEDGRFKVDFEKNNLLFKIDEYKGMSEVVFGDVAFEHFMNGSVNVEESSEGENVVNETAKKVDHIQRISEGDVENGSASRGGLGGGIDMPNLGRSKNGDDDDSNNGLSGGDGGGDGGGD